MATECNTRMAGKHRHVAHAHQKRTQILEERPGLVESNRKWSRKRVLHQQSDAQAKDQVGTWRAQTSIRQMVLWLLRLLTTHASCLYFSLNIFSKNKNLANISTRWICNQFLKDCGLRQYQAIFKSCLVDGRILATLQRKDLEKYLNIHKRIHQTSILTGIDLLRKYDFNIDVRIFYFLFFS